MSDTEYGDVLYHTEVRWLSHGIVLECFMASGLGTEMLMNEKGKLSDESVFGI
jgi:hypothetical protein